MITKVCLEIPLLKPFAITHPSAILRSTPPTPFPEEPREVMHFLMGVFLCKTTYSTSEVTRIDRTLWSVEEYRQEKVNLASLVEKIQPKLDQFLKVAFMSRCIYGGSIVSMGNCAAKLSNFFVYNWCLVYSFAKAKELLLHVSVRIDEEKWHKEVFWENSEWKWSWWPIKAKNVTNDMRFFIDIFPSWPISAFVLYLFSKNMSATYI